MPISASMVDFVYELNRIAGFRSVEKGNSWVDSRIKVLSHSNKIKLRLRNQTWILQIELNFSKGTASVQGVVIGHWSFVKQDLQDYSDLLKALWYFRRVVSPDLGLVFTRPWPPGHLKSMFGYYPELGLEVNSKTLLSYEREGDSWLIHPSEKIAFQIEEAQYKTGRKFTKVVQRHEYRKEPKFYRETQTV
jgi:hypothetical protein